MYDSKKKISLTNDTIKEQVLTAVKKTPKFVASVFEEKNKPKIISHSKEMNSVSTVSQLKKSPRELAIAFQARLKKNLVSR